MSGDDLRVNDRLISATSPSSRGARRPTSDAADVLAESAEAAVSSTHRQYRFGLCQRTDGRARRPAQRRLEDRRDLR